MVYYSHREQRGRRPEDPPGLTWGKVKVDKVAPEIAAQAVKTAGYGQGYGGKPSEIRIPDKSGKQDKRE